VDCNWVLTLATACSFRPPKSGAHSFTRLPAADFQPGVPRTPPLLTLLDTKSRILLTLSDSIIHKKASQNLASTTLMTSFIIAGTHSKVGKALDIQLLCPLPMGSGWATLNHVTQDHLQMFNQENSDELQSLLQSYNSPNGVAKWYAKELKREPRNKPLLCDQMVFDKGP
jgi:hypothetical protein